jgi:hypothetical protein
LEECRRCEVEATTYKKGVLHPEESHYGDNKSYNFKEGEVYRLWHPNDVEVHLGSFLILSKIGTEMTCLRLVNKPGDEHHYGFTTENHRLEVKRHIEKCDCDTKAAATKKSEESGDEPMYLFHLTHDQDIKDECWVNFTTPWNINWQRPYKFTFCGRLQEECFVDVRKKTKKSFVERLRLSE